MSTHSSSTLLGEDARAFLQRRIARFGLLGSCIGWFFLAYRLIYILFGEETVDQPSLVYHFLAALSLMSLWFVCRQGRLGFTGLRIMETTAVLVACAFYSMMGASLEAWTMPHYIVILALSFGLIARAVYVPSSARHTTVLTALSGIPMLISTYLIYRGVNLADWQHLSPDLVTRSADSVASGITGFSAAWWICTVALCSGASRVIYGLRKQVRDVKRLGQYTLVEKLGEGGMGVVYQAKHAMLRRPTAVKLLPSEKSGQQALARFEKEVQLTALLTHPNTVTIFDYGRTPDGIFYYAMELLDGATLAEIISATGSQAPARVASILRQVAGALAEAHSIDLIHRDIKPANIMLVNQGGKPDVAKVVDFGLVRQLASDGADRLTKAEAITGTPQYLAPEAITNPDSVDARIDIYGLGAVAYYLLTAQHVFEGATVVEVCAAHLHTMPVPPSERIGRELPPDLEALVLRCLAKDPADRPQTAEELIKELTACRIAEWTETDADTWWQEHGRAVEASRAERTTASGGITMDVDMARRSPGGVN